MEAIFNNVLNIFQNPVGFGVNLVLTTIIGGSILLFLLKYLEAHGSGFVTTKNVFLLVFLINLVNHLGITSFIMNFIPSFFLLSFILPVIVWLVFTKALLPDLEFSHTLIFSLAGYVLNLYLFPFLVSLAVPLIPL